jgi:hypothetical protein
VIKRFLFAFDADANELWTVPAPVSGPLVADRLGAYFGDGYEVEAYNRDGSVRATFAGGESFAEAMPDGIITVLNTTLADFLPTGEARWTTTLTADGEIRIRGVATTASGVVVSGTAIGTPLLDKRFVAQLGLDGTVQWVTTYEATLGGPGTAKVAVTSDGVIVVGEGYFGGPDSFPAPEEDAFVDVVDRNGLVRTVMLGGKGVQLIRSLVPGPDGTVVVDVGSSSGELKVGSRTFSRDGARDYLIELVP